MHDEQVDPALVEAYGRLSFALETPGNAHHLVAARVTSRRRRRAAAGVAAAVLTIGGGFGIVEAVADAGGSTATDPASSPSPGTPPTTAPTHLTCTGDLRERGTMDYFAGVLYAPTMEDAAQPQLAAGEATYAQSLERDKGELWVLRADGTARMRIVMLHHDEGWYINTFESCAGEGMGSQVNPETTPAPLTSSGTGPTTTSRPQRSANEPVVRQASRVLGQVGVTGISDTDGGHRQMLNASLSGVWRDRPVIAYVVPASSARRALEVVSTTILDGTRVQTVTVDDNALRPVRFRVGPDVWEVTVTTQNGVGSSDRRTTGLARALIATS